MVVVDGSHVVLPGLGENNAKKTKSFQLGLATNSGLCGEGCCTVFFSSTIILEDDER